MRISVWEYWWIVLLFIVNMKIKQHCVLSCCHGFIMESLIVHVVSWKRTINCFIEIYEIMGFTVRWINFQILINVFRLILRSRRSPLLFQCTKCLWTSVPCNNFASSNKKERWWCYSNFVPNNYRNHYIPDHGITRLCKHLYLCADFMNDYEINWFYFLIKKLGRSTKIC